MKYTFFVFMLLGLLGKAQNLVQNGSFEEITACPELNSAYPLSGIDELSKARYWHSGYFSPDLFSSCNGNILSTNTPFNFMGYQIPYLGNNYAGLGYLFDPNPNFYGDVSEIMINELKSILIEGDLYEVSFRLSASELPPVHANNLGILFTNETYNALSNPAFKTGYDHGHVDFIINDTASWVPFNTLFQADSNYQYLMIGNFLYFNTAQIDTVASSFNFLYANAYIDDLCVVPLGGDCSIPAGRMRIEASEQQLLFAATPVGQQENRSFWLRNPGLDTLHVSGFSTQNPVFIAPTGQYSVPPGDSVLLSVGFAPTAVQNYQDSLYITHDAPRSRYKVALEGEGLPVGVRGYAKAAFSVFPNPARGLAYLVSKDASEIVQVKLYNQLGQAILLQQTQSAQVELDLAGLAPGLYLVELVLADGRRGISKLLVINY